MTMVRPFLTMVVAACLCMACATAAGQAQARPDTMRVQAPAPVKPAPAGTADTARKKKSLAAQAALRSAILPGAGQVYNRKYWKLPLVYGALAIPVVAFAYNLDWYRKCREAYSIRYFNDTSIVLPNLPIDAIDPQLQPLSTQSLRLYRNEFRKNVDLSVLALLALWGLNVVDAAVDGHLRSFDVSEKLSLQVVPTPTPQGLQMQVGMRWTLGVSEKKSLTAR